MSEKCQKNKAKTITWLMIRINHDSTSIRIQASRSMGAVADSIEACVQAPAA
jgi:hypothetical protein